MVDRIEAHIAVPRTPEERQRGERRPLRLRVAVGGAEEVVLVAPQVSQLSVVVDESTATLMPAVRHARSRQQHTTGDLHPPGHAGVDAANIVAEIIHTT